MWGLVRISECRKCGTNCETFTHVQLNLQAYRTEPREASLKQIQNTRFSSYSIFRRQWQKLMNMHGFCSRPVSVLIIIWSQLGMILKNLFWTFSRLIGKGLSNTGFGELCTSLGDMQQCKNILQRGWHWKNTNPFKYMLGRYL